MGGDGRGRWGRRGRTQWNERRRLGRRLRRKVGPEGDEHCVDDEDGVLECLHVPQ